MNTVQRELCVTFDDAVRVRVERNVVEVVVMGGMAWNRGLGDDVWILIYITGKPRYLIS